MYKSIEQKKDETVTVKPIEIAKKMDWQKFT